jgi:hypothetical protein
MYRDTALLVSPLAAELPDSITTRRTPARLAAASVPARSGQRADQLTTDVAGGPRYQDHQASSSSPLSRPS